MSVHIADVGLRRAAALLRRQLDGSDSPGCRHAEAAVPAPLGSGLPPPPKPGRVASWPAGTTTRRSIASSTSTRSPRAWPAAREMRAYALGKVGRGHTDAARKHNQRSFHHEAVFARFRPYGAAGLWDGRQPLAGVAAPAGT